MKSTLIAACGMNCNLCIGHLRDKNTCPGCRFINEKNSGYCKKCIIKNCKTLKEKKMKYCSKKCEKYPCTRLKNLDKRYRTKYHMSMIENLELIDEQGVRKLIQKEKKKWICKSCGGIVCVHKSYCMNCKREV